MSRWYVAAVQPKSEAFARVNLVRQGFRVYRPMTIGERRLDGHIYRVPVPMFPGYLFVQFDQAVDRWRSINGTRGVVKLLPLASEIPLAIPDEIIEKWIAAEINGTIPLDDAVGPLIEFQKDEVLRVKAGPFTGFGGTCMSSSKGRVTLLMGLFGRQTVVELSSNEVELAAD